MSRTLVDSGIEWIGKIPNDWKITKLKYLYESTIAGEVIDKSYWNAGDELLYTCQQTPMKSNFVNFPDRKRTGINDLLLTRNATPYIFIPKNNSIYSNVVQKITIKKCNNKNYVRYALISGVNNLKVNGDTIPSWNMGVWNNIEVPLIDLKEQTKIANYLDNKCSIIDKTIDDNKKAIELLEEYKKSAISNSIKRGLRKENLKETDIPYIEKIPVNWKCVKFDRLFEITKRIAGSEGYNVLSITQRGIKIKDIESNEGQLAANYSNYQLVEIGDFAMNHMDLLTGWVDCSKYNGVTSPDYRVFKLKSDKVVDKRYCLYYLQLCYKERIFYGFGQGVSNLGRWRLPKDEFLGTYIPLPKLEEQQQICDYLDKHISLIDKVITYRKQIIEKLEEYKKSLIYEVVTGKKEV